MEVKPFRLFDFSSEKENYFAKNILNSDPDKSWKSSNNVNKKSFVEIQMPEAIKIESIEIKNCGSAYIEIQVSRSKDSNLNYQVLMISTSLLTSSESLKGGEYLNHTKIFKTNNFTSSISNQKWDRIKFVCSQPFNSSLEYGLNYVKIFKDDISKEVASPAIQAPLKINISNFMKPDFDDVDPLYLFKNRNKLINSTTEEMPKISMKPSTSMYTSSIKSNNNTEILKNDEETQVLPETQIIPDKDESKTPIIEDTQILDTEDTQKIDEDENDTQSLNEESDKVIQTEMKATTSFQVLQNKVDESDDIEDTIDENCIMKDVVFVLSGYQNPLRNQLREKALKMGAKYEASWNQRCTHLICAFPNTPKFKEVAGRGFILSDKWITDCFGNKKRLSWKNYVVGSAPDPHDSLLNRFNNHKAIKRKVQSENITSQPKPKVPKISKSDTLIANDSSSNGTLSSGNSLIPMILNMKNFYLYGKFDETERNYLKRFIISFGGIYHEYMGVDVDYVITNNNWNKDFDEASDSFPNCQFVRPSWLHECDEENRFVPFVMHIVKKQ